MHASELIELATIVSAQGPALIRSGARIPADGIEQYWTASKVRLDRWAWRLKRIAEPAGDGACQRRNQWPAVRGIFEEILTGEMLTRVWTAALCAYDRRRGSDEVEPVARSVFIGHIEARHRVLTMIVRTPVVDSEAAVKLNRLRRRTERWTDLLVGHLAGDYDTSEFAFDPARAKEFARDLRQRNGWRGGRLVWPLLMASLRAAFRQILCNESPNAELNAQIAAGILSCFPRDVFDSTGLMRSLWLMRLSNMAEDTQGKIDDLLQLDRPAAPGHRLQRFRD
jgi:hypothetical protein